MPSITSISPDKLARLIGLAHCPAIVDVRSDADFGVDARFVPGALRRLSGTVSDWGPEFRGRSAIVIDRDGRGDAEGVAAWMRHAGAASADVLTGGHDGWIRSGGALIPENSLPKRDPQGRTVWVTRSRPKVDRIACPWLIRRFVDPDAVFLFVAPAEVSAVAERFGAAAFDIEGAYWSHRDERCTFDTMLEEWGLTLESLRRLAVIVRGADTARLDMAPEAAGLLAASLGLSRMYADDLEQLEVGLRLYDAFYRWCRDATDEPHTWPATKSGKAS